MADDPRPVPDDDIAPPPPMPVRTALYLTPDGKVRFGALFAELLPIARALDPTLELPDAPEPVRP